MEGLILKLIRYGPSPITFLHGGCLAPLLLYLRQVPLVSVAVVVVVEHAVQVILKLAEDALRMMFLFSKFQRSLYFYQSRNQSRRVLLWRKKRLLILL